MLCTLHKFQNGTKKRLDQVLRESDSPGEQTTEGR